MLIPEKKCLWKVTVWVGAKESAHNVTNVAGINFVRLVRINHGGHFSLTCIKDIFSKFIISRQKMSSTCCA